MVVIVLLGVQVSVSDVVVDASSGTETSYSCSSINHGRLLLVMCDSLLSMGRNVEGAKIGVH